MEISYITVINPALLVLTINKWNVYQLACGFFVIQNVSAQGTKTFRYYDETKTQQQSLTYIIDFIETNGSWNKGGK